jgi:hypothetical protein
LPVAGRSPDLFPAIRSGDSLHLERLLASGADVNDSLDGFSVLMVATLCGTPAEMKLLIGHGAQVNYANSDGITALWLALPDPVRTGILLDHGAKAQALSKEGYSPLVKLALMPGTVDLFRLLIAAGADPRKSGPDNMLLYNAAASGDTAILGLLLRAGLSANDTLFFGDNPITAALFYRQFSTVKMLVEAGANLNVQPHHSLLDQLNGFTPLMWAADVSYVHCFPPKLIEVKGGQDSVVKRLIESRNSVANMKYDSVGLDTLSPFVSDSGLLHATLAEHTSVAIGHNRVVFKTTLICLSPDNGAQE